MGFFGEVTDFYLGLLLLFHEVFFNLLDPRLILGYLLLVLLGLEHLFLLYLFDIDVEIFFLFHQLPELILALQFVSDEGLELGSGVVFDELYCEL